MVYLNTEWLSCKFFFCLLLLHLCLVSLESPRFDRGRSKVGGEQCAACQCVPTQQACTRMGCVEDVYRVCLRILWDVYVWSIGVRYIYLISVNVYGGYTYIRRFSATVSSFALDIYRYIISLTYFIYSIYSQDLRDNTFDLQFTVACGLRFHFTT